MTTILSDKELHAQTGKLVNTPYFIDDAVRRYRSEGERGLAWEYDHLTKAQREQLDYWLIGIGHKLASEPGTNERRFRLAVIQRAGEMNNWLVIHN